MNAIGIDPGSSQASAMRCDVAGAIERFRPVSEQGGVLPSAAILADSGAPSLEWGSPLSPHGIGGEWPPEAMVGETVGARRVPLALVLASMEIPFEANEAKRREQIKDQARGQWKWPSFSRALDREIKHESSAVLIRRSLHQLAGRDGATVALAIPNALPLLAQTSLLGPASARVRLIWRCMAAGLGYTSTFRCKPPDGWPEPAKGQVVLHIHLGLDGFEATVFAFEEHRGKAGPSLIVPARQRASFRNTVSRPSLGLSLLANSLRGRGVTTPEAMWEATFGGPLLDALASPSSGASRGGVLVGAGVRKTVSGDWPAWDLLRNSGNAIGNQLHSEAVSWVNDVERLVDGVTGGRPSLALLTGELWEPHWENEALSGIVGQTRLALMDLIQRRALKSVRAPDLIARGAAIFASRRERGWATYLDQLPTVEILVSIGGQYQWTKILASQHCDAGSPVSDVREGYRLAAGQPRIELPVYVDEFGPDSNDVLKCEVKFEKLTEKESAATVRVEVQAASGLPVVRAEVHGEVSQAIEVDWARDRENFNTRKSKKQFLDELPMSFPPIEGRVASAWWSMGGRYKTRWVAGNDLTGDALCQLLLQVSNQSEAIRLEVIKALSSLAQKREFVDATGEWNAATDLRGESPFARHLDAATKVLIDIVQNSERFRDAKVPSNASRALGWLFCQEPRWIRHVMGSVRRVPTMADGDGVLVGMGHCIVDREDLGRVVAALAARLRSRVQHAENTGNAPVGRGLLRAMGSAFALRPESLAKIDDRVADQLADDLADFMLLMLAHGGKAKQKFQEALRTFTFSTRRRAYQPGYVGPGSHAFRAALQCVTLAYVHARASTEYMPATMEAKRKRLEQFREDLMELKTGSAAVGAKVLPETRQIIKKVNLEAYAFLPSQFPLKSERLLSLLIQVTQYIEGRGTGILIGPEMDDDDDGDGG